MDAAVRSLYPEEQASDVEVSVDELTGKVNLQELEQLSVEPGLVLGHVVEDLVYAPSVRQGEGLEPLHGHAALLGV